MCNFRDRYVIKEEAENILKCKDLTTNSAYVVCKGQSDTSNNRGNWNNLKIIHTIPEQYTGKARNERTTVKTAILGTAHILREVLM
jgi:hypothetical protein